MVWFCRHKSPKIAHYYYHEYTNLFWGDFLFIFIEAMLEVLFSAVLYFYVPTLSYENNPWLTFCAIMFIIITSVVLPLLFMYVFTRNVYKFK